MDRTWPRRRAHREGARRVVVGVLGWLSPQEPIADQHIFHSLPQDGDPPAICEISPLVSYSGEVRVTCPRALGFSEGLASMHEGKAWERWMLG